MTRTATPFLPTPERWRPFVGPAWRPGQLENNHTLALLSARACWGCKWMAVDPATKALLDQMASAGGKPLHESTRDEARELSKAFAAMAGRAPAAARVEDHELPVEGGSIALRVLVP